jgi:hypothetical protein
MAHKHVFEAVNRTLQHVMGVVDPALKDMLFGGKVVVMGGDFRHERLDCGCQSQEVHSPLAPC